MPTALPVRRRRPRPRRQPDRPAPPVGVGERLSLRVACRGRRAAPRGRAFDVRHARRASAASSCWEGGRDEPRARRRRQRRRAPRARGRPAAERRRPAPQWRLPGDLGRRYAAVSGDHNPIHLHALTAKPFGFPRAIAHGMWTKARCLAALERLPDAFTVDVTLPEADPAARARGVRGKRRPRARSASRCASPTGGDTHLEGTVTP